MPPPVLVNPAPCTEGSKTLPCTVWEGSSVRVTLGLITEEVAVMSRRCLLMRYWAAVTRTVSGSGFTVTVVNSGAEVALPVLVAVMASEITTLVTWPSGSVGAVNVTVPELLGFCATLRLSSAGDPDCVTAKATVSPLGSVALTPKLPAAPEKTLTGGTWFTVGAPAGLMVMPVLTVDDPHELVTARVAVTGLTAPIELKMGLAMLGLDSEPELTVQRKVSGAVPVALPLTWTVPPAGTV